MRNLLLLLLPFVLLFAACQKEISFETTISTATGTTAVGIATGTAKYKLIGAGSTCTGAVVSGIYQAGTALVASDSVQLQINVDTIGTYTISTNTTNGFLFSATGSFTQKGAQTITLIGSGTPVGAANITFTPPVGVGCSFVVTVTATETVATSGDYYPTTTNSTWKLVNPKDSTNYIVETVLSTNSTFSTNSYRNIATYDRSSRDTGYIRKNIPNYYQYSIIDGTSIYAEQIIIKDNVPVGTTWQYQYPITQSGVSGTLTFSYLILEKNVPATVGTFSFPNVIKVRGTVTIAAAGAVLPYKRQFDQWYALNVGPVKFSEVDFNGSVPDSIVSVQIKSYKIY